MCFLHSKAFSGMVGKSSATGKAEELAKLSFGPLHLRDGSDRDGWKVGVGTRGIPCVLEIYRWFERAVVVLGVPKGFLGGAFCKISGCVWFRRFQKKQTEAFASLQHEHRFLLPGDVYSSWIATSTRSHKKCSYETNVAVSTCPIIHIRVQDGATPQL